MANRGFTGATVLRCTSVIGDMQFSDSGGSKYICVDSNMWAFAIVGAATNTRASGKAFSDPFSISSYISRHTLDKYVRRLNLRFGLGLKPEEVSTLEFQFVSVYRVMDVGAAKRLLRAYPVDDPSGMGIPANNLRGFFDQDTMVFEGRARPFRAQTIKTTYRSARTTVTDNIPGLTLWMVQTRAGEVHNGAMYLDGTLARHMGDQRNSIFMAGGVEGQWWKFPTYQVEDTREVVAPRPPGRLDYVGFPGGNENVELWDELPSTKFASGSRNSTLPPGAITRIESVGRISLSGIEKLGAFTPVPEGRLYLEGAGPDPSGKATRLVVSLVWAVIGALLDAPLACVISIMSFLFILPSRSSWASVASLLPSTANVAELLCDQGASFLLPLFRVAVGVAYIGGRTWEGFDGIEAAGVASISNAGGAVMVFVVVSYAIGGLQWGWIDRTSKLTMDSKWALFWAAVAVSGGFSPFARALAALEVLQQVAATIAGPNASGWGSTLAGLLGARSLVLYTDHSTVTATVEGEQQSIMLRTMVGSIPPWASPPTEGSTVFHAIIPGLGQTMSGKPCGSIIATGVYRGTCSRPLETERTSVGAFSVREGVWAATFRSTG